MKTKELHIDVSKAMAICIKHGLKVYPVASGRKFKIEVDNNGTLKRYNKEVVSKELNKAMSVTYKHFAVQFLKQDTNANSTKKN
ncbi:hypothetical protein ACFQ5N_02315 [Lutibacter holmesii]|uniref:Uncharacterized protein n=1 Tax=Lutibacter holmesii TaxID=1137985 RepID=A0ABW3WK41_9FLAO